MKNLVVITANCRAGSVVTKDIPDNVVAYGSPCKVIREI
jgi:acetyltransferase-like isoleucine patch superfamily enzyme